MKYCCPLLAVSNMEISKKFYQEVLNQKIIFDIGPNVAFEGSFALQEGYADLVGFDKNEMSQCSKNFELYFEEDDLDSFTKRLEESTTEIKYVHKIKEYPWGQRVVRFYDPDMHIIEVGENMELVAKRFLKEGLSAEETSAKTMYPIEFIKKLL